MGAHRLQDLSLIGRDTLLKELTDFDLYHLRHVERLTLQRAADGEAFDLSVEAVYQAEREYLVTLVFAGVKSTRLPELSPSFFFGELEIEDLRDAQLEGIRYRARDFSENGFDVHCQELRLERITPR